MPILSMMSVASQEILFAKASRELQKMVRNQEFDNNNVETT